MATASKTFDVSLDQWRDKAIFFAAFALGIGGTFGLKHFEAAVLLIALYPASILILYAFIGGFIGRKSVEPEMIGDNCYYLGFIFTLVSLAITLYALGQAPEDIDLVRTVISGFGIAITSTILGIFLRAFFQQFRADLVASERRTRIDIAEAVRNFQTELSQSVTSLRSFSIEVQQSLREHHAQMKQEEEAFLKERGEAFRDMAEQAIKETTGSTRRAAEEAVKEIGSMIREMNAAWSSEMSRITENVEKSSNVFRGSLESAGQEMGSFREAVVSQSAELHRIAESAIETAVTTSARMQETISEQQKSLDGFAKVLAETVRGSRVSIENSAAETSRSLEAASVEISNAAQRASGNLDRTVNGMTESMDQARVSIERVGKTIYAISNSLGAASNSAQDLSRQMQENLAQLREIGTLPRASDFENISQALQTLVTALKESKERRRGLLGRIGW